MSFSSMVKHELIRLEINEECCKKALTYGMLLFGKHFDIDDISIQVENAEVAYLYADLCAQLSCSFVDIISKNGRKNLEKKLFDVTVPDLHQREMLLDLFGHNGKETNHRINIANMENECCIMSFIRGAFLSCGTISNPAKEYRLEFAVPYYKLCCDLAALISNIDEMNCHPKVVQRKGVYVLYIKESELITDILAYMGAGNSAMEIIQVKMVKEVRNNINRKINFETANIDKTVQASSNQIHAINYIIKNKGIQYLPEDLQEIALFRMENPEMSLRELGENLSVPISRSGVNHRLKRILTIAEQLKG